MNLYLCLVRNRKKLDKYFKINKIRNKQVIDIKKLMDEERIKVLDNTNSAFFKVVVWNKIKQAIEKKKDIYYMPNFSSPDLDMKKLFGFKENLLEPTDIFNLLLFYDEFIGTKWLDDTINNLSIFDHSQILKDY